ncbi:anthrone oxygenase family protein [Phaeobacter sp. J2-8]|uniref:anthrone oxygenase family protein n=1 Tax=Phaeobacter sp. J2-8 TaxID=2931394 RepID=UPI001FD0175E|nr:anthrone oxygenase family protein [Phaeobacter sp. J2-8]MCJ7872500.1 DUF1772 domain-containing protein [Phaeobacter sp. J2-8]
MTFARAPFLFISTCLAMLLSAAIFGFFFAWVCSTMWGLDAIDPRISIAAMNGMNASVRNAVFAPAFFGTPLVLALTAVLAWRNRAAALWFGTAALLYIVGAFAVTMAVNVPMNEALMTVTIPEDPEAAQVIWQAYSSTWQVYNIARTIVTGFVFLFGLMGVIRLARG